MSGVKDEFVMDENGTHWHRPAFQPVGAWSYDAEYHWLIFTETEVGADAVPIAGASVIVAYDVPSTWAARMLPLLNVEPPDGLPTCHCTGLQTAHNRGCPHYVRPRR
jgi:hypothetical protein